MVKGVGCLRITQNLQLLKIWPSILGHRRSGTLLVTMICPNCARENRPGAKFCDGCGVSLGISSDNDVSPSVHSIEGAGSHQLGIGVVSYRAAAWSTEDPFVGRDAEMAELRAALHSAFSRRGRLVMLVGEPGAGKTKTAQQLADYALSHGAQALWGRCYENPGAGCN